MDPFYTYLQILCIFTGCALVLASNCKDENVASEKRNVRVAVGEQAILTCQPPSDDLVSLSWTKVLEKRRCVYIYQWLQSGKEQNLNSKLTERFDVLNDTTLRINVTSVEDGGLYKCFMLDENGHHALAITLTVSNITNQNLYRDEDEPSLTNNTSTASASIPFIITGAIIAVIIIGVAVLIKRGKIGKCSRKYSTETDHSNPEENGPCLPLTPPEEQFKARTLLLLPTWGKGLGGIYNVAHTLISMLKQKNWTLSCVLGSTMDELSETDMNDISETLRLHNIIEPNIEDKNEVKSPEERMRAVRSESCGYFKHILHLLEKFDIIVSFTDATSDLAKYLLSSDKATHCTLLVFNDKSRVANAEMCQFAEYIRSAQAVFCIGHDAQELTEKTIKGDNNVTEFLGVSNQFDDMFSELYRPFSRVAERCCDDMQKQNAAGNTENDETVKVTKNDKNMIGRGACGEIYKWDKRQLVVRKIAGMRINRNYAVQEFRVLVTLSSTSNHIVEYKGSTCSATCIYMTMEYAGVSMQSFMQEACYKELDVTEKAAVLGQMFDGLEYLHANYILHQDIKPSNIMLSEVLQVKIVDAGMTTVKSVHGDTHCSLAGTRYYQAPEVCLKDVRPEPSSDVWTTCLVGSEWCTGKPPFPLNEYEWHLKKQNKEMPYQFTSIRRDLRQILESGLNYDATKRPSAGHIKRKIKEY